MKTNGSVVKVVLVSMVVFAVRSTASGGLPDPGMEISLGRTALVVTDPQNDFLSPNGATWGVVGKSVQANNTVENIETLSIHVAKSK